MTIPPIETEYAGCRFRSRLEARWAVFFDKLGIRWEYEPQGFQIGPDERPYLPDFRLPAEDLWVEVKGSESQLDVELAVTAAVPHYGLPGSHRWQDHDVRLLILGPHGQAGRVTFPESVWTGFAQPVHTALAFRKGDLFQWDARFTGDGLVNFDPRDSMIGNDGPTIYWNTRGRDWGNLVGGGLALGDDCDDRLAKAYRAARSARFEHGQSGAPSDWPVEKNK